MTNVRISPLADVRRIAILRALQLGDLLVAVPALRAIRAGYPDAEITFVGLPWAASFAARYPAYIDRFAEFPGWPGIAELPYDRERTERFVAEQRACGYDLVVQLHGSGRTSNGFCLALGGRITAGYYDPALGSAPERMALATPYSDDQPELLRNLGIASLLGCPVALPDDARLEFPLTDDDRAEADRLLGDLATTREAEGEVRPLIALHPGARPPARRWPAARFARLADLLIERSGARIVLTGGPGEEATARAVAEGMRAGEPLNLVGKTTLGGLAAVLARLDLFIGNDTGPAHLAEAVGTPTVRIFGPADPARWAPLDTTRHRVVREDVFCSPCGYWECPTDHRCLLWIAPERVYAAAAELLGSLRGVGTAEQANRQARPGGTGVAPTADRDEASLADVQPAQAAGEAGLAPTATQLGQPDATFVRQPAQAGFVAEGLQARFQPPASPPSASSTQEGAMAWSA